uniref:Uncharacterized protein n=1 Tax=Leptospira ellisii TaxID=2023197 RepID=A0A2N0B8R4_9LEPT|nr:hypothetical protein CH379_10420 [Leptospira ellisii]
MYHWNYVPVSFLCLNSRIRIGGKSRIAIYFQNLFGERIQKNRRNVDRGYTGSGPDSPEIRRLSGKRKKTACAETAFVLGIES